MYPQYPTPPIQSDRLQRLDELMRQYEFKRYFGGDSERIRTDLIRVLSSPPSQEGAKLLEIISRRMLDIALYWPIDPYIRDLLLTFATTCKQVYGGFRDLVRYCDAIERIIIMHLTTMDAIAVLRRLVRKIDAILANAPPAFELSRIYMQTIEKTMEEGRPINKYDEARREVEQKS